MSPRPPAQSPSVKCEGSLHVLHTDTAKEQQQGQPMNWPPGTTSRHGSSASVNPRFPWGRVSEGRVCTEASTGVSTSTPKHTKLAGPNAAAPLSCSQACPPERAPHGTHWSKGCSPAHCRHCDSHQERTNTGRWNLPRNWAAFVVKMQRGHDGRA